MGISAEWLSIRRKLPLLISALLCVVVAALSWASYRRLEGALISGAGDRVMGVATRLAEILDDSGRRLRRELRQLSDNPALVQYVAAPDDTRRAAVEQILEKYRRATPQTAWFEIQRTDGGRLLTVGEAHSPLAPVRAPAVAPGDTASRATWVGPLVAIGDAVYFNVVSAVVRDQRDTLGYLVENRRLTSAQGADALRGLIGSNALILLGNRDGGIWTDLVRPVAGPPTPLSYSTPRDYVVRDGARRLGAAAVIAHSPWVVWIELTRSVVLSPARRFLLEIAGIAVLIVLTGAIGAWLLSRHITAPLLEVTRAAQEISSGDYSRRAAVVSRDEAGLLAASFNSMADQIEQSKRELEDRVAARTAELKTAVDRLEQAQEELVKQERLAILGQLAGGVGHELRNPLGVMTNALYYLGMVLHDAPPNVKEYLDIVRMQIGLSEKIVGDLLDFARVKTPNREAISLSQVVAEQLQRVTDLAAVNLEMDVPPTIGHAYADRVQVGQAVLNLITNAVQAITATSAQRGGRGTLTIRARPIENGQVELAVSDTGGGIKPEHLQKLFEPLFTTKARGIGLGLAVSRTLMRANGGDIRVINSPGEGATFVITLPAADVASRAAA